MIALVNPPGIKTFSGLQMHTPNPPLGLAYVAAALREAGFPYRVIDATGAALDAVSPYPERSDFMMQGLTIEETVRRIPADADVIGVSCMFSTLWPLTHRVADAIRARFPRALLVLGGEHGTAVPEHVLGTSPFDVVVLGEGEETFVELLRARASGRPFGDVKGIAYRDGGRVVTTGLSARRKDVDAIPVPDWASFPIREYIDRHQTNGINLGRSMPILGTRGCPFQCTFCSNPAMWTQRWIARNPILLADEMERYAREYGVTNFDFQDLTAIVKRQWIVDFCGELIRRDLKITWQMPSGTRAEVFDAEVADLLYRSGCRALAFAPESGSPEILKVVKKQVDLDHMLMAMRAAVRRGLKLSCFIVIGFPDDTPATLGQTLSLIRRMAVLGVYDIAVSKFVPYPGSALFRRLQQEGKLQLDDEFFVSPMDFYTAKAPSYADAISSRRLYWTMLWMFVNFYVISFALRPWRVARALARALVTGREETRYAKWFVDVLFTRRRWRRLAGGAVR
jgi:anaerobic magnesium-protoporphyrin IX monomethyl ester cyclase